MHVSTERPDTRELGELKELWTELLPSVAPPAENQWRIWTMMHNAATVREALVHLGIKYARLNGQMDIDHILRFASAVMNRLSKEMREKQAPPLRTTAVLSN